jgi:hypothetical protein
MASAINHSCLSNARRSFIGDLQLVRATCDIPANTELTFWYKIPTGEGCEMKKGLEVWGFRCECVICLDWKETSKKLLRKRSNFLGDLRATLEASNVDTAKAERLLTLIDQTYKHPPTTVPRLALRDPYLKLANIYARQQMADNSVSMALKALGCLGFVIKGAHLPALSGKPFEVEKWGIMMDGVVDAWIHLCNAYTALAPHLFPQAEDCAKLAYKICIGEDETFRQARDAKYV